MLLPSLRSDHRHYEILLDYLEGVTNSAEVDETVDYTDLVEVMDRLEVGLCGQHLAKERVVWDQLTKRNGSRLLMIEVVESHRRAASDKEATLKTVVLAAQDGIETPLPELLQLSRDFIRDFRQIIALEERAVFPLVNQLLEEEDWRAIHGDLNKLSSSWYSVFSSGLYSIPQEGGGFGCH